MMGFLSVTIETPAMAVLSLRHVWKLWLGEVEHLLVQDHTLHVNV